MTTSIANGGVCRGMLRGAVRLALALALPGCALVIGASDYKVSDKGGGGGVNATSGTAGATATSATSAGITATTSGTPSSSGSTSAASVSTGSLGTSTGRSTTSTTGGVTTTGNPTTTGNVTTTGNAATTGTTGRTTGTVTGTTSATTATTATTGRTTGSTTTGSVGSASTGTGSIGSTSTSVSTGSVSSSTGTTSGTTGTTGLMPRNGIIDDFEDGNGEILRAVGQDGFWYVFNDGTGTQVPAPTATIIPSAAGANGSLRAFNMTGTSFSTWGAGLGTKLNQPGTASTPGYYDASAYKCLTFSGKSTASSTVMVKVGTPSTIAVAEPGGACVVSGSINCDDNYAYNLHLTTAWTRYTINFTDLRQQGWGVPGLGISQELARFIDMEFSFVAGSPFDLSIDDVAFSATCGATSPGFNGIVVSAGDQLCSIPSDCNYPASGVGCQTVVSGYGPFCSTSCTTTADCAGAHRCVFFNQSATGICMHDCTASANCVTPERCISGNDISYCGPPDWLDHSRGIGDPCRDTGQCLVGLTCTGAFCTESCSSANSICPGVGSDGLSNKYGDYNWCVAYPSSSPPLCFPGECEIDPALCKHYTTATGLAFVCRSVVDVDGFSNYICVPPP